MPYSKIIDIDKGAREHYHVPKYQREYTWGKREWDQLLLDVEGPTWRERAGVLGHCCKSAVIDQ